MTTRNLRRMYFACSWLAYGIPVLWVLAYLCLVFTARTAVTWLGWVLVAVQLAAMAGGRHAFRALRRRGTHPWM